MRTLKKDCRFYGLPGITYQHSGKTVEYAYCSLYGDWESRMQAGDLCPEPCEGYLPTTVEVRRSKMKSRPGTNKLVVGDRQS